MHSARQFEVAPDIHPCISDKLSTSPPGHLTPSGLSFCQLVMLSSCFVTCSCVFTYCLFLYAHQVCLRGLWLWSRTFLYAHLGPQSNCLVQKENRLQWEFIFLLCTHSLASHWNQSCLQCKSATIPSVFPQPTENKPETAALALKWGKY